MLRLFVMVVAGLLCACGAATPPIGSTKQLTEADDGHRFELYVGDKLEITLPGNPTSGFQWDVSKGDTSILRQIGEPRFEPSSGAIGSNGTITLSFDAVGIGQMELKLIYHRPFEKDTQPAQTFAVTVIVQ